MEIKRFTEYAQSSIWYVDWPYGSYIRTVNNALHKRNSEHTIEQPIYAGVVC